MSPLNESLLTDTIVLSTDNKKTEKQAELTEEEKKEESRMEEEQERRGLKVLFLSSDTGGGHRASAESLARQFELLFPGSTYELLDLATEHYPPPYGSIVSNYKHLSANPSHWKLLYGVTNAKVMERSLAMSIKYVTVLSERAIRKKIQSIQPDVVVSVHPLQTSVPITSCAKISHETGKHLPIFTVVTDLGSAHCSWFANGVEKMFVGSTQIRDLAKDRGQVPDEKLVLLGLPIRHDFAVEAENLGDRMSEEGKLYQQKKRTQLGLPANDRKTLLVMGGGEGVGSLSNIVNHLYYELTRRNIDAVIMVVCGRNETLKESLEQRNWPEVFEQIATNLPDEEGRLNGFLATKILRSIDSCGTKVVTTGCIEAGGVTDRMRRILSTGNLNVQSASTPLFIPVEEGSTMEPDGKISPPSGYLKSMSFGNFGYAASDEDEEPYTAEATPTKSLDSPTTSTTDAAVTVQAEEEPELNESGLNNSLLEQPPLLGKVDVVGLGFVKNMAEYMVAADILISKAGPGTISEAAALSLPVMLTSFLPGQEEGNVDYVIDGKFGAYCDDSDPQAIGEEIADWLTDETKLAEMSRAANHMGAPHAARDIVQRIGDSTLKWIEHNEGVDQKAEEQRQLQK